MVTALLNKNCEPEEEAKSSRIDIEKIKHKEDEKLSSEDKSIICCETENNIYDRMDGMCVCVCVEKKMVREKRRSKKKRLCSDTNVNEKESTSDRRRI